MRAPSGRIGVSSGHVVGVQRFERSALADLLGADFALAEIHKLYACHDRLLAHKQQLFDHLVGRWRDLFNVSFDLMLYDLTSTYFEADPPFPEDDKRRHGYSRDHRPDWWKMGRIARSPLRFLKASSIATNFR
jgi:hypothetical protein